MHAVELLKSVFLELLNYPKIIFSIRGVVDRVEVHCSLPSLAALLWWLWQFHCP